MLTINSNVQHSSDSAAAQEPEAVTLGRQPSPVATTSLLPARNQPREGAIQGEESQTRRNPHQHQPSPIDCVPVITEAGYTQDLTGTEPGVKKEEEDMEIDMYFTVAEPRVKEEEKEEEQDIDIVLLEMSRRSRTRMGTESINVKHQHAQRSTKFNHRKINLN
ncbi:hypothetical protein OEA41_010377 [Lepraria neglecta]|uniref:Uncharacterized protein n=1 Tax=Lepraria neglecta TaxID=209136 RepID=A0AAD9YWG7_9LECA|nr:hypothetical protein OEA41_010377 [Lepraria neglecta]